MELKQAPDKNLAFELLRVTESAALAAARWLGKGAKEDGDGAAVDAMRQSFNSISVKGRIVIGEGAKDEAPMLYNGELVGDGSGLRSTSPSIPWKAPTSSPSAAPIPLPSSVPARPAVCTIPAPATT